MCFGPISGKCEDSLAGCRSGASVGECIRAGGGPGEYCCSDREMSVIERDLLMRPTFCPLLLDSALSAFRCSSSFEDGMPLPKPGFGLLLSFFFSKEVMLKEASSTRHGRENAGLTSTDLRSDAPHS